MFSSLHPYNRQPRDRRSTRRQPTRRTLICRWAAGVIALLCCVVHLKSRYGVIHKYAHVSFHPRRANLKFDTSSVGHAIQTALAPYIKDSKNDTLVSSIHPIRCGYAWSGNRARVHMSMIRLPVLDRTRLTVH